MGVGVRVGVGMGVEVGVLVGVGVAVAVGTGVNVEVGAGVGVGVGTGVNVGVLVEVGTKVEVGIVAVVEVGRRFAMAGLCCADDLSNLFNMIGIVKASTITMNATAIYLPFPNGLSGDEVECVDWLSPVSAGCIRSLNSSMV